MSRIARAPLAALLVAAWLAACNEGYDAPPRGDDEPPAARAATTAPGGPRDVERARALWSDELDDYRTWEAYPGHEGWQPGKSPHGSSLKLFVDDVARGDPLADGAIVVKENYTAPRDDALVSVTVMKKIAGYAPDHGDWFWVEYTPDGEVLSDRQGVPLAGRIGVDEGCIACHARAGGGDYLFTNDT